MRRVIHRLLGCGAVLVLVLAGCGGDSTHHAASLRGAGQGADVRFTGAAVPGTVYVAAGPDELSLDAYRLSGRSAPSASPVPLATVGTARPRFASGPPEGWAPVPSAP